MLAHSVLGARAQTEFDRPSAGLIADIVSINGSAASELGGAARLLEELVDRLFGPTPSVPSEIGVGVCAPPPPQDQASIAIGSARGLCDAAGRIRALADSLAARL